MAHQTLETLNNIEENIKSLQQKRTDLQEKLAQLLARAKSMTTDQLEILNKRLDSFIKIHDTLTAKRTESEWLIHVMPKLFNATEKQYTKLEEKLLQSKRLDKATDPTWNALHEKIQATLGQNHIAQVKAEFVKHFPDEANLYNQDGDTLKQQAGEFFERYLGFIKRIEAEKANLAEEVCNGKKDVDMDVLEAEIDKQLKIVQAQMLLALSAAKAEKKAEKLKLAGTVLDGVCLTLAGAGIGVSIGVVAGSATPVVGMIILGGTGLVIGGVIGAAKGYHAYQEAKAQYQAKLASTFKEHHHKLNEAVSINAGIASIKTREAFTWLMTGPQKADIERMLGKYNEQNSFYNKRIENDLEIRLRAEFAANRGAYCSMLHNIIRASIADSALQAAAGLKIAPPFDTHSAVDLASQFTLICHTQIGTARAMAGLKALPEFPADAHIPVLDSAALAYQAAFQLAANAESLAALAHQIILCTNLGEDTREELLTDVYQSLVDTIRTYDELIEKQPDLELQASLGNALLSGMFGDLEYLGHKVKPKIDHSCLEHRSYSAVVDYMKDSKFHDGTYVFHQSQLKKRQPVRSKSAAETADVIFNALVGSASGMFYVPAAITPPEFIHADEVGGTGYSMLGVGAGAALAGLSLAAGMGAYYLNKHAAKAAEKLCIFGDVSHRREKLQENLAETVEMAYFKEDKLHTLIEAPSSVFELGRVSQADTIVSSEAQVEHTTTDNIRGTGLIEHSILITPGQAKYSTALFVKLSKSLDFVKKEMMFHPRDFQIEAVMNACYKSLMKILQTINQLSQDKRLAVVTEKEILILLKDKVAELEKLTEQDFERDSPNRQYHKHKIDLLKMATANLKSKYEQHVKVAEAEPINSKAILIDSNRVNDRLKYLVRLMTTKVPVCVKINQQDGSIKRERRPASPEELRSLMDGVTREIRLMTTYYKGEFPRGTDIKLAQVVLDRMKILADQEEPKTAAAQAVRLLQEKPAIKQEMIDRLAVIQKTDVEEERVMRPMD